MAEQMRPLSREEAPDPSHSYERAHPTRESGTGRLDQDTDKATPEESADKVENAAPNRQDGTRQVNAHDVNNDASRNPA
jgi:hypothetical protein